jgi:dTDP-4-dehydrorhamnose 3,5-epimerase
MGKKLNISSTEFNGLYIITPNSFEDQRGAFSRIYCEDEMQDVFPQGVKQINHSVTKEKGTVRGLHFQYEPHAEVKIVKCLKGSVLDIVVDIRQNSPTFLKVFSLDLSQTNQKMLCIPKGFAHGFQTLEDDTELLYLHSNVYSPLNEGGLNIKDPLLCINLPLEALNISQRDLQHPFLTNDFIGVAIDAM